MPHARAGRGRGRQQFGGRGPADGTPGRGFADGQQAGRGGAPCDNAPPKGPPGQGFKPNPQPNGSNGAAAPGGWRPAGKPWRGGQGAFPGNMSHQGRGPPHGGRGAPAERPPSRPMPPLQPTGSDASAPAPTTAPNYIAAPNGSAWHNGSIAARSAPKAPAPSVPAPSAPATLAPPPHVPPTASGQPHAHPGSAWNSHPPPVAVDTAEGVATTGLAATPSAAASSADAGSTQPPAVCAQADQAAAGPVSGGDKGGGVEEAGNAAKEPVDIDNIIGDEACRPQQPAGAPGGPLQHMDTFNTAEARDMLEQRWQEALAAVKAGTAVKHKSRTPTNAWKIRTGIDVVAEVERKVRESSHSN